MMIATIMDIGIRSTSISVVTTTHDTGGRKNETRITTETSKSTRCGNYVVIVTTANSPGVTMITATARAGGIVGLVTTALRKRDGDAIGVGMTILRRPTRKNDIRGATNIEGITTALRKLY
jgi:hypothetical protein